MSRRQFFRPSLTRLQHARLCKEWSEDVASDRAGERSALKAQRYKEYVALSSLNGLLIAPAQYLHTFDCIGLRKRDRIQTDRTFEPQAGERAQGVNCTKYVHY